MWLRQDIAHLFALLLVRESSHGGLEEKDAENAEKDDELEQDKPHQGLTPGHVAETVPVQGRKKRNDTARPVHGVVSFHKCTNSFQQNQQRGHLEVHPLIYNGPIVT
jgi:hypothetical protein